jgi:hypothetical protein
MPRYAAKLLFDWFPDPITESRVTRLSEERIVTFTARSPREAVVRAKRKGRDGEAGYDSGHRLRFVGILQLMALGIECDEGEVWWELRRRRLSKKSVKGLLPSEKSLWVFTDGRRPRWSRSAADRDKRVEGIFARHPPKASR